MTELLKQYKFAEQQKETLQRESCPMLVAELNYIVQSQAVVNGSMDKLFGKKINSYNTQCPEFDAFKKKVNQANNNIELKCDSSNVDYIQTHVDIKNDLVTYDICRNSDFAGIWII